MPCRQIENGKAYFMICRDIFLFLEYEIDCQDETAECCKVVPFQFHLEGYDREYGEHNKRDNLLDDLELHDIERSPTLAEAKTVGRYLKAVFEKCYSPAEGYHSYQRQ